MHPFEDYLHQQNLEALAVSIAAQVRYATIWNAMKGHPISSESARKIQQTVLTLTKVPYTGPMALRQEHPLNQFPVLHGKNVSKHHPG